MNTNHMDSNQSEGRRSDFLKQLVDGLIASFRILDDNRSRCLIDDTKYKVKDGLFYNETTMPPIIASMDKASMDTLSGTQERIPHDPYPYP